MRMQEGYLRAHGRVAEGQDIQDSGVGRLCMDSPLNNDKGEESVYLHYGLEEEVEEEEEVEKTAIHTPSSTTQSQEDIRKEEEEEEDEDENEGKTVVVVEEDLMPGGDSYMETSHLMKLMNEVVDQRAIIAELRQQVTHTQTHTHTHTRTHMIRKCLNIYDVCNVSGVLYMLLWCCR